MTTFINGPAVGVSLLLQRAPLYLRVVQGPDGTWDALDQLGDTPKSDETIVVYEMVGEPSRMHVQRREGGRRVCGWYEGGSYRLIVPQPDDTAVRATSAWRAWVSDRVGHPLGADGTRI